MSTEGLVEIMYVGKKPMKRDNVCGNEGRIWNGLGSVLSVTPFDAPKLIRHHDIWIDVTGWATEQRDAAIQKVQEEIRTEMRRHQPLPTLASAEVSELEAEIARRKEKPKVAARPQRPGTVPPLEARNSQTETDDGNARSRPVKTEALVADIAAAVVQLDPAKSECWEPDGNPALPAVMAILGYEISRSELRAAQRSIAKKS